MFASETSLTFATACDGTGDYPLAPHLILSIGGFGGDVDFSLRDQHALIMVEATITLETGFSVGAAYECTFPFPTIPIGVIGPFVAEMGYEGFVSIGGEMSAGSVIEVPIKLGFKVDHGDFTNLSDVGLDGDGTIDGPTFVATAGAHAELSEKIFAIGGAQINHGPEVSFEYEPLEGCATINARYRVGIDAVVGRWGVEWSWTAAELVVGPFRIAELGNCLAWIGSVEFSLDMTRETVSWGTAWESFEHDYTWKATSTSSSLLNAGQRTFGPDGSAPDNMDLEWSNVVAWTDFHDGDFQYRCAHAGGGFPGNYFGRMYDTDFNLVTEPGAGDTVYLEFTAHYEHASQTSIGAGLYTCDAEGNGPIVLATPGETLPPEGGSSCLAGTYQSGNMCFVIATISDDARHIDVDLTMNGVATTRGVYDNGNLKYRVHDVTQHMEIHLELVGALS